MKLIIINLLLFSECVFSFLHLKKTYYTGTQAKQIYMQIDPPIRDIIKYKPYLEQKPLGKLYQDIENHNVDGLIFSSDLTTIYSKKHLENSDVSNLGYDSNSIITDYSVTNTHPFLVNQIVETSNKNKVVTNFLVEPTNTYGNAISDGLKFIGSAFDAFFFPTIIFFTALSFFNARRNTGPSGMGGNPFYQWD